MLFSIGDVVEWECVHNNILNGTIIQQLKYDDCIIYKIETDRDFRWVIEHNLTKIEGE